MTTSAVAPARANHFNLIRLILAALVIVAHSPEMLDGNRGREPLTRLTGTMSFGELAVDGFFLLSGYLILQSWQAQPSAMDFLRKRALRILPGYVAAAALCILCVGPLAAGASGYFSSFWLGGTAVSVLTLSAPVTPEVFAGSHYAGVNNALWTIRYEFICYLLVLALGMFGIVQRRRLLAAVAAALPLLFVAAHSGALGLTGLSMTGADHPILRLSAFFAMGMLYAGWWPRPRWSPWWGVATVLVLGAAMLHFETAEPALLVCGAYLLFTAAFAKLPCMDWVQRLPDASYGTYLYGWPAGKLLAWYWPGIHPGLLTLFSLLLAYACGLASWHWVEKPALAFKSQRLPRAAAGWT